MATLIPRTPILVGGVQVDTSHFNLKDHSTRIWSVRTKDISLIVVITVIVGLRLLVRHFMVHQIFLDDVLIVLATATTVALASVCIAATNHGLGTHVWMIPFARLFDEVKDCIQYLFVCQVLYSCATAFTKLSIMSTYLRFIRAPKFRICMYVTAFFVISLFFAGIFVTVFQCRPISGAWDFTNHARVCINFVDYLFASSAISMATDLVLCILPMPYLWKLQMPVKQRVILCIIFGGGVLACVAAMIRLALLEDLRSLDITYESVPSLNLSVIECSIGIMCVSIPALRPLAVRLSPRAFTRGSRKKSSTTDAEKCLPGSDNSATHIRAALGSIDQLERDAT